MLLPTFVSLPGLVESGAAKVTYSVFSPGPVPLGTRLNCQPGLYRNPAMSCCIGVPLCGGSGRDGLAGR